MPLLVLALLLATPPPKIAVLDVRLGAGVDAALGPYLTQVLAKEVAERTGAFPLVSADVTAMLGFERTRQTLGCAGDDSQCLAELTAALGVQQVVTASVALSEGRYLVTASLIDTRRAPMLAIIPGVFIAVTVLMFNILGDSIRDLF